LGKALRQKWNLKTPQSPERAKFTNEGKNPTLGRETKKPQSLERAKFFHPAIQAISIHSIPGIVFIINTSRNAPHTSVIVGASQVSFTNSNSTQFPLCGIFDDGQVPGCKAWY
jgi:hypothetical protein